MRKFFLIIIFIFLLSLSVVYCQYENPYYQEQPKESPTTYLGLSSGINNFNGLLGGFMEYHPMNKLTFLGGLGLGFWGYKASAGLRMYKNYPVGFYYTGSFSYHSGFDDIELEMETLNGNTETVIMNWKPAYTLNLTLGYQFGLSNNKYRLFIEGGYAIALQTKPYEVTNGVQLSEGSKAAMDIFTPGGLIISIGGSLGF